MATSELWQSASTPKPSPLGQAGDAADRSMELARVSEGLAVFGREGTAHTVPISRLPNSGMAGKRLLDVAFSSLTLVLLSPVLLVIALAIKLDSVGSVLYAAERIGKNGRVFRCFKFRTMVRDAAELQASVMHRNERDMVLFKVTNDPRVTRVGRILRKYSLDEMPQFLNVLRGEMSVVGPRPPLAIEVQQYRRGQLRRLDVAPGITGLWQVQCRHDPSFESYVSLDLTYIENWSLGLDLKIMVRTLGVVLSGSGI